jgi:hypothetical protein
VVKVALIVKEIKGHKYIYEVSWDPEKKKQIWNYVGKERDAKGVDPEKLKDDINKAIKNDYRIKISKKDLKHLRNVVEKAIDKHKGHW